MWGWGDGKISLYSFATSASSRYLCIYDRTSCFLHSVPNRWSVSSLNSMTEVQIFSTVTLILPPSSVESLQGFLRTSTTLLLTSVYPISSSLLKIGCPYLTVKANSPPPQLIMRLLLFWMRILFCPKYSLNKNKQKKNHVMLNHLKVTIRAIALRLSW